jgi:hypothetical protein
MKTRSEAVDEIQRLMGLTYDLHKEKGGKHHIGYVEMRLLLDFLYGPIKEGDKPLTHPYPVKW